MIVLDTHVLFWWLNQSKDELTPGARLAIEAEEDGGTLLVSSMSAWEIALLVAARRLTLSVDLVTWLENAADVEGVRFVPLDNMIAVASINLPGTLHRDPADRIIVATARHYDVPLVTKDERLRSYPHVRTIW